MLPYRYTALLAFVSAILSASSSSVAQDADSTEIRLAIPSLHTDNRTINDAYRIAIGDLVGNVAPYQNGLLERPTPVILAGLDYGTPWTRDASINAWSGASLIMPRVAQSTLLSVLQRNEDGLRIGGQYWDCIVWVTGAWHHYLCTGDKEFLALAQEVTRNSLTYFEETEFDRKDNLFRGPGWSDGVAGYPLEYGDSGGSSAILDWPKCNPDKVSKPGYGIPMKALSSNCLYYNAYVTAGKMARELGTSPDPTWADKAGKLKKSINQHFWLKDKGHYRFLVGPFGPCDHQEGLGHAYALLFGVADAQQAEAVFANLHVTPAGLPCEWPSFPRYDSPDGMSVARHAGTVWPQIQGIWAETAARARRADAFGHELLNLATHARRDRQFAEIYHPVTGEIYGGMQEASGKGIILWEAASRQTWAATAYVRMILFGLVGLRFDTTGFTVQPCVPKGVSYVELRNLSYRGTLSNITIHGRGTKIKRCTIDGQESTPIINPSESPQRDMLLEMVRE